MNGNENADLLNEDHPAGLKPYQRRKLLCKDRVAKERKVMRVNSKKRRKDPLKALREFMLPMDEDTEKDDTETSIQR